MAGYSSKLTAEGSIVELIKNNTTKKGKICGEDKQTYTIDELNEYINKLRYELECRKARKLKYKNHKSRKRSIDTLNKDWELR